MLNPNLKLNPKLFNEDVERKPMREGFGRGLLLAGEDDKNIVSARFVIISPEMDFKMEEKFIEPMINNKEEINTLLNRLMELGWVVKVSNMYNS